MNRKLETDEPKHALRKGLSHSHTLKHGELYMLMDQRGDIPGAEGHGLGLYLHDMRFLSAYTLRFAGVPFEGLGVISSEGHHALLELGNPPMTLPDGREIDKLFLGAELDRTVDGKNLRVVDKIRITSYLDEPVTIPLTLRFDSDFRDMFQVRGLYPEEYGEAEKCAWRDETLVFSYDGLDDTPRETAISFSRAPTEKGENGARFRLELQTRGTAEIEIVVAVREGGDEARHTPYAAGRGRVPPYCRFTSSDFMVGRLLERSTADLRLLRNSRDGFDYYAAGIPWFAVVFGRDSILTSMMTLALEPKVAESTLRLLASLQGRRHDERNEEEPGRILHELRCGELARSGRLAKSPDYGTVDATALFLLLFRELANWTGSLDLFQELQPSVRSALDWIDERMERLGGWLGYQAVSEHACHHQGWKDVDGGIVHQDGRMASPPIFLVEVQGQVYAAWKACAELYRRLGEEGRAVVLEEKAEALRRRFDEAFWLPEEKFLALALDRDRKPLRVVTSNMGQALWTGIVDPDRSAEIARHLLDERSFSGWGVRTLSAREKAYSPIGYHSGGVWPHDNALVAAGLKRYHHHLEAEQVIDGIIQAAFHFPLLRLPELFCGFPRRTHPSPVCYPTACSPQAWAAAAVPSMLTTALGFEPDAFKGRLTLRKPRLPASVPDLGVRGLRVGEASVDLFFKRHDDHTSVTVERLEGDLEVVVDPEVATVVESA